MLKILVIGGGESKRIGPLLKSLSLDSRFDIEVIDPVYLKSFDDPQIIKSGFDISKSTIYMMRKLSLGEIGCTLAHNKAREYLTSFELGGVILEDDARIPDLDYFYTSATSFLESFKNPSVLNFSSLRNIENIRGNYMNVPSFQKRINHSPLTVGYVLNRSGAEMLSNTIYRQFYCSDWPFSKINKFVLSTPAVAHGDLKTQSVIDPENLLDRNFKSWKMKYPKRLRLFSFYWYVKNRKTFISLREYTNVMLLPRIFFLLSKVSSFFGATRG